MLHRPVSSQPRFLQEQPRAKKRQLTFTGNEGYELADTLLHALLCFFGNLRIVGESGLHYAGHCRKVSN